MTTFQFCSDLHIEYNNDSVPDPLDLITPVSENLILAGDIGSLYKIEQLTSFLKQLCQYFKKVIYIPGNQEYYTQNNYQPLEFGILKERLLNLEKSIYNLYVLDRDCMLFGNVMVVGCTLWSKPKCKIPPYIVRIKGMYNQLYNRKHQEDLKYVKKMIQYCKRKQYKLLMVTHHCPTYLVLETLTKKADKIVSLYVSNLDYLLKENLVNAWICGHIHHNFDFKTLDGTRIVGNQLGKPKDNIQNYKKQMCIKL